MRKNVPLIGVCPEKEISYPVNSANKKPNELTNGHTHFFLIGSDEKKKYFNWGDEAKVKAEIAKRIAKGRTKYGGNSLSCKIVVVLIGDNTKSVEDLVQANENKFPIIVLEGSQMSADVIAELGGMYEDEDQEEEVKKPPTTPAAGEGDEEENIGAAKAKPEKKKLEGRPIEDEKLKQIVTEAKIHLCSQNSEHIANIAHLLLTITL